MAKATQHILPREAQYIRRFGLYASRTKATWLDKPYEVRLAPEGWKKERLDSPVQLQQYSEEPPCSVSDSESRSTWAKLLALITEPQEVRNCGIW
jgi:hypothetical protein